MSASRLKRVGVRRSSLGLVAVLLLASAVLRLGGNSQILVAFAADKASVAAVKDAEIPTETATDATVERLAGMIKDIQRREDRVAERERVINERQAAISIAELAIEKNLAALEQAEKDLAATISIASTAAEDDLTRLTAVYESMKPKEAAQLFEEMSPEFAAGFLARMRADVAAEVMAGLNPTTAYSISVIMAGRNALAPTQ